jgi:hypothetical protein
LFSGGHVLDHPLTNISVGCVLQSSFDVMWAAETSLSTPKLCEVESIILNVIL